MGHFELKDYMGHIGTEAGWTCSIDIKYVYLILEQSIWDIWDNDILFS